MMERVDRAGGDGAARTGVDTSARRIPAPGLLEITDIAVVLGLPLLTAIAWFAPEPSWRHFCRLCVPFYAPAQAGQPEMPSVHRRMRALLGARALARPIETVAEALIEEDILSLIELLREYAPGGWRPAITLCGGRHLDAALARENGAVLWVGHFVHANLVAKMALHRAGYRVSHLSHPRHGFSGSRFGMRWLNRVHGAAEDRYLGERVLLDDGRPAAAMGELLRRLRNNGVVSISVRGSAKAPRATPFLDGALSIAGGAPRLALATGAALLPVFPVRTADGRFTVFVEPALDAVGGPPDRVLGRYAALLECYVLAYPAQWLGWIPPRGPGRELAWVRERRIMSFG